MKNLRYLLVLIAIVLVTGCATSHEVYLDPHLSLDARGSAIPVMLSMTDTPADSREDTFKSGRTESFQILNMGYVTMTINESSYVDAPLGEQLQAVYAAGPECIMVRELEIHEQDLISFLMGMFMSQTSLVMTTESGGLP